MRKVVYLIVIVLVGLGPAFVYGQNAGFGDIRGTVTDSTGAVVPDVAVSVENVDTGVVLNLVSNKDGIYDTSSIVPGAYKVTFSRQGFETFVRGPFALEAGFINVNAVLKVGSEQQQVVVNGDITLLKTESGEQSTNLTYQTMNELPNYGQSWQNSVVLLPGASGTTSGSGGTQNPGEMMSINGSLPMYSNFLLDGASVIQPHSNNAPISVFESTAEVQISTSSFSAEYGVGGVVFNEITKGGTKDFHGTAYEFLQNDDLNAHIYNFTSPLVIAPVPFQRFNQFGGSIAGPILKKKLFFYFNAEKIINHSNSVGFQTVPSPAMIKGDLSGLTNAQGSQIPIFDPTTPLVYNATYGIPTHSQFPGNVIPENRIDSMAKAIMAYYPAPNVPGAPQASNYYYNDLNPTTDMNYFGRLDYDISKSNRLTFTATNEDSPYLSGNVGICPINCNTGDDYNDILALADVWTISPSLLNEARMGFMKGMSGNASGTLGKGYPAKLGWTYAETNEFPSLSISGVSNILTAATNAVYKAVNYNPSDAVTMIRGKHILRFGGELIDFQDNSTPWGNEIAGKFGFTGIYTEAAPGKASAPGDPSISTTGFGFADFLLGDVQSWSASYSPAHEARQKTPQMFFQDDYKLRPNLTLNLGIRYQIQLGWHENHGWEGSFDPTITNTGAGTSYPAAQGAMWFAINQTNGRQNLEKNSYNIFLPRIGFAYQPDAKTTIRGGFGIYSYAWSLDAYGNGIGYGVGSTGNGSDTTGGTSPYLQLSGNGTAQNGNPVPFTSKVYTPTVYNNQGVSSTNYNMPVSRIEQWTLSVGREISRDVVVNVSYVGSKGFDLNFYHDINQVPQSQIGQIVNGSTQKYRKYPIYQTINQYDNNALSNYNALQIVVDKRFSHGLTVSGNYTWSHMLDEFDQGGQGSTAGNQPYQNALNVAANYGPSNFDIRNMLKALVVYDLPIGAGQRWVNNNSLLDLFIGGWRASATFVSQAGNPFNAGISGANNSGAISGTWYPNVIGNPKISKHSRNINAWFNPAAYAIPTTGTFGNEVRNGILTGPPLNMVNASLRKSFNLWERVKLEIRGDAENALNHPNFGTPALNINVSGAGDIRSITGTARNIQIGAHLTF
jgi:hypothetical protein